MTQPLLHLPSSLDEAVDTLDQYDGEAVVIAGGTALTLMLQRQLLTPQALVSLSRIPGLDEVSVTDGELRLGAFVTHHGVTYHPIVRSTLPVLAATFRTVGNAQVRACATVGGVLAEADFASDPPACLLALDATVEVRGVAGQRNLGVDELIQGFYETTLEDDEIITGITVLALEPTIGSAYLKYTSRSAEDRPCVGVAAVVQLDDHGGCSDLRIAVSGATEVPFRKRDIEQQAIGRVLQPTVLGDLADAYTENIDAISDLRGSASYRVRMVRVWVERAIGAALADAENRSTRESQGERIRP